MDEAQMGDRREGEAQNVPRNRGIVNPAQEAVDREIGSDGIGALRRPLDGGRVGKSSTTDGGTDIVPEDINESESRRPSRTRNVEE